MRSTLPRPAVDRTLAHSQDDAVSSHYLHGTAPDEQRRLSRLNALVNASSLAAIAPRPGERVIDFGCGLAQLTRDLARATGVRALGLERSEAQRAEAQRQAEAAGEGALVELRAGDVLDPPLAAGEWGGFDLAHARFVLEHVPDPARVVAHMARAVGPGGRVALEDDDHDVLRVWPEVGELPELWRAYVATYTRLGNDPYVGRRLVALLHDAGLAPVTNGWLWFGGCAGDEHFPALVTNMAGLIAGAREAILAAGAFDPPRFDAALHAIAEWGARPDAALWFARCRAIGVRRA